MGDSPCPVAAGCPVPAGGPVLAARGSAGLGRRYHSQ